VGGEISPKREKKENEVFLGCFQSPEVRPKK
jgi:hypothetical protein